MVVRINYRICRCSKECGIRIPIIMTFPSGKKLERIIKCNYCGQSVDQNSTNYRVGKWFHDGCISDYKNFYMALMKSYKIESDTTSKFRDYILFQMIMRKDLRLLQAHWKIVLKQKAVPIMLRPAEYIPIIA